MRVWSQRSQARSEPGWHIINTVWRCWRGGALDNDSRGQLWREGGVVYCSWDVRTNSTPVQAPRAGKFTQLGQPNSYEQPAFHTKKLKVKHRRLRFLGSRFFCGNPKIGAKTKNGGFPLLAQTSTKQPHSSVNSSINRVYLPSRMISSAEINQTIQQSLVGGGAPHMKKINMHHIILPYSPNSSTQRNKILRTNCREHHAHQ